MSRSRLAVKGPVVLLLIAAAARPESPAELPWRVIFTKNHSNGQIFRIHDEPVPEDCHMELNADYGGSAVRWGHKPAPPVRSAAECCRCAQLPCNAAKIGLVGVQSLHECFSLKGNVAHTPWALRTVGRCCRLCKDWPAGRGRQWRPCNVWVFCADPSGA